MILPDPKVPRVTTLLSLCIHVEIFHIIIDQGGSLKHIKLTKIIKKCFPSSVSLNYFSIHFLKTKCFEL
jgi:hypothetical protein